MHDVDRKFSECIFVAVHIKRNLLVPSSQIQNTHCFYFDIILNRRASVCETPQTIYFYFFIR